MPPSCSVSKGGADLGSDLPLYDEFAIGGLFRLSGFENDQVRGDTMLRGGIIWTERLGTLNPLLGEGTYAGISLEAGNALASGETWQLSDLVPAGAVYAGLDSVFGPIYVAWGVAEGGFETLYFVMGHPQEMGLLR